LNARKPANSVTDRFGSTLFLAALAHGVLILGVTFTVSPFESAGAIPSLNVTLLLDSHDRGDAPEDADLIANRSQQGSGEAGDGQRPVSAPSADHSLSQTGEVGAPDLYEATPRPPAPSAEMLMTREASDQRINAEPRAVEEPADRSMRAAALLADTAPLSLVAETDFTHRLPDASQRELLVTPSTRESELAPYLESWRRRVENIGTANFPDQLRGRAGTGRPLLEVAINSNGRLEEIIVRRSSGDSVLDQAALQILRLASPFEAFPDDIRSQYDVLRFAYEWDFFGGRGG
jgi:periplasmic protein TonB